MLGNLLEIAVFKLPLTANKQKVFTTFEMLFR